MKKFVQITLLVVASSFGINSCDKVEFPYVLSEEFDTTLYPGNYYDYTFPTFGPNTNTERNVLIEDYTGHKCSFCPAANTEAANIEAANPGRVFVATIHAGAASNGISDFQKTNPSVNYTRDFTTPEGLEMAGAFFDMGVGFDSNPKGTVNRISDGNPFFISAALWADSTASALERPLDINLQAESNYFPETNGCYLHVETEFINDVSGDYNVVVYVIKEKIVDWQLVQGVGDVPDYEHHNVHIGNVYGETWGRAVATGGASAGTKVQTDFSYTLPNGMTNDDLHFLIFVYSKDTWEVMQVIKEDF